MSIQHGILNLCPPYDHSIGKIPIKMKIEGSKLIEFSNLELLPCSEVRTFDYFPAYVRSVSLRDATDSKGEPCQYGEFSVTYLDPESLALSFQRNYSLKVERQSLYHGQPVALTPALKISKLAKQLLNCDLMIFKFNNGAHEIKESFPLTVEHSINEGRYSLINATRDPKESSKFNFSNKILLIEGEFNTVNTDRTRMSGNITITTVLPEEKGFANQCTLPVTMVKNLQNKLEVVSTDSRYRGFTFFLGTASQRQELLKEESVEPEEVFV